MNINDFAEEACKLAESKGLWENGGDDLKTVLSLIHCEWSEALQEARAGRPMYYHRCYGNESFEDDACEDENNSECYYKVQAKENECNFKNVKPEGIAVELVDGIILICSMMHRYGCKFDEYDTDEFIDTVPDKWGVFPLLYIKKMRLPWIVFYLHELTSKVNANFQKGGVGGTSAALEPLRIAAGLAWIWIELHDLDPEKILMEKHKYNQTREYKHGRKF